MKSIALPWKITLIALGILFNLLLSIRPVHAGNSIGTNEVLIGSSLPLEGPFSAVGIQTKQGVEACFSAVNAAGGINGRKLRLIAYNDGYEPVPCVLNTQKLIDEDKVFALTSYVGTPTSVKASKVWQSKTTPVIGFYTGAAALRNPLSPYNFHVRASYANETDAIVDAFTGSANAKKIAIFYQNDAFGEAVKTAAENSLKKYNLTPVAYGNYARNTLDVEKGLADITASQPDAIIMVGTYGPLAKFVKLAKASGLKKTLFHTVSFVGPEALADALGADSDNVFVTQVMPPYADSAAPLAKEYIAALKASAPDAAPTFPGFEAYANAKVLVEGLKRAGANPSQDDLIKAIESINPAPASLGLDVSYSATKHDGLSQVFITHIVTSKYELVSDWTTYKH